MIIAVCVMAAAYFYGKLSPEQVWGILIGYNREELQYLSLQSLSQLVRIWDLETGMLIFCANMIRSGLFFHLIQLILPGSSMALWPGLFCLLLSAGKSSPFWKRWTLLIGSLAVILPELLQLILAFNISASLLTRRKQWMKHSTLLSGLISFGIDYQITFPNYLLILAICFLTAYGWERPSQLVKAGSLIFQEKYHAGSSEEI